MLAFILGILFPVICIALLGWYRPLIWGIIFVAVTIILAVGMVLGLALDAMFINDHFKDFVGPTLYTNAYVESAETLGAMTLAIYIFVFDMYKYYFYYLFNYGTFLSWGAAIWSWWLIYKWGTIIYAINSRAKS